MRFPDYAVLRHADNQKWFGLIMDIPYERLGEDREGVADVLNVKMPDAALAELLAQQPGYYPGYHLRKGNWISILLDGTVPLADVCRWLDESYRATASAAKKKEIRPPKDWLVPANPKYYDADLAFDDADEIVWKFSNIMLLPRYIKLEYTPSQLVISGWMEGKSSLFAKKKPEWSLEGGPLTYGYGVKESNRRVIEKIIALADKGRQAK